MPPKAEANTRECAGCKKTLNKDSFSKNQWTKGAQAKCTTCTGGAPAGQAAPTAAAPVAAAASSSKQTTAATAPTTTHTKQQQSSSSAAVKPAAAAAPVAPAPTAEQKAEATKLEAIFKQPDPPL